MWVFVHTELPLVAVRATQESVGERVPFTWIRPARFQFDDEEGKKRAEEEVCHLQAHHKPPPPTPLPHDCGEKSSTSVHLALFDERTAYTAE